MRRPNKAEQAALSVLADHGLSEQTPVRVERLVGKLGAELRREALEGGLSGLLYRADDGHVIIGVNASHPVVRQRFTIAHEIGHLQLHSDSLFVDGLVRRDPVSSIGIDPREIEANAFAAELLMPRASVLAEIEERVPAGGAAKPEMLARRLAQVFNVSEEAMAYRLVNLGISTSF